MAKHIKSLEFECLTREQYRERVESLLPLIHKAVGSNKRIKTIICLIIDKDDKSKKAIASQMFAVLSDKLRPHTALTLTLAQKEIIRKMPPKEKQECVRAMLNELLQA